MGDPAQIGPEPGLRQWPSALPHWAYALFWLRFPSDFVVFGLALGLGHQVIRRRARGRVLVADIVRRIAILGWLLLVWPLVGLVIDNVISLSLTQISGAGPVAPTWVPDIIVMGFGLLLPAIMPALREAIRQQNAVDLTI